MSWFSKPPKPSVDLEWSSAYTMLTMSGYKTDSVGSMTRYDDFHLRPPGVDAVFVGYFFHLAGHLVAPGNDGNLGFVVSVQGGLAVALNHIHPLLGKKNNVEAWAARARDVNLVDHLKQKTAQFAIREAVIDGPLSQYHDGERTGQELVADLALQLTDTLAALFGDYEDGAITLGEFKRRVAESLFSLHRGAE